MTTPTITAPAPSAATAETLAPPEPTAATAAGPARRRFTADEYYAMDRAGIFGPEERLELLDGDIFVMPPMETRTPTLLTNSSRTLLWPTRAGRVSGPKIR